MPGYIIFIFWSVALLALAWFIFRYIHHEYLTREQLTPRGTFLEILIFALHGMGMAVPFVNGNMPPLTNQRAFLAAAIILAVLGLCITAASMGGLGWLRTSGRTVGLKQDGLYRYSRNPQMVGYGLVIFSVPLFYASWWLLAWALLYLPIANWMVNVEEEHLLRMAGDDFKDYCQRVPRYIGPFKTS